MNTISYTILAILLCSFSQASLAQHIFTEHTDWGKMETEFIPAHVPLTHAAVPDSLAKGDTLVIEFLYPNQQIAIEGICVGDSWGGKVKRGTWTYNYEDGSVWSTRQYSKRGSLTEIHDFKSKTGEDLDMGYGRWIGKNGIMNGNNFIYNQDGSIDSIASYFGGKITDVFAKDLYDEKALKRMQIRKFAIDENRYLEELSIEEAIEKQKEEYKPILMNITTTWNGYSKKGFKTLFTQPEVAEIIDDNFYFVYLDLEDSNPIELEYKGEMKTFEGSKGKSGHTLAHSLASSRISSTPTFLFLGEDLEVIHKLVGIELKDGVFLKQMVHFLSGKYKKMTWKEYLEKNK